MTVHFAAARTVARSPIARALARRATGWAANDNGCADTVLADNDDQLHAALRHFARHGLGAAQAARNLAETGLAEGDQQAFDRWLGICRTFDRRMADRLARRCTTSHLHE